jgi:hypothetical protein
VRGTNPLSGLGLVGNGNCANEAITQAIRLVTGYWACATPYFLGPDANRWDDIVRDASLVLGSKKAGIGFKPTADIGDIERDLSSLEDGEIALLGSGTPKHGHATLVLKVKGKLIHINNQGWEPKVSTLAAWGEQWRAFAASQNEARVGFHVKLVFANALRF